MGDFFEVFFGFFYGLLNVFVYFMGLSLKLITTRHKLEFFQFDQEGILQQGSRIFRFAGKGNYCLLHRLH